MKKLNRIIATVFGLGYSPVAPGTVGSLAGLGLCLFLHQYIILYMATFFILFTIGVISAGKVEEDLGRKDPGCIVIDEFACIFIAFFLVPITSFTIIAGFVIYRLIDIIKVPPTNHLEKLSKGWGIMLDDALCGLYTNLILQFILILIPTALKK